MQSDVALFWLLDSARTGGTRFRKTWQIEPAAPNAAAVAVTLEFELRDSMGQPVVLPATLSLPDVGNAARTLECPWEAGK
jgi:hypothetical protein